jgi:hypothetical protein
MMAAMAAILELVSIDYLTKDCLIGGDWSGGRFLSMTSAAAHSRWLWQPSLICCFTFPLNNERLNQLTHDFCGGRA